MRKQNSLAVWRALLAALAPLAALALLAPAALQARAQSDEPPDEIVAGDDDADFADDETDAEDAGADADESDDDVSDDPGDADIGAGLAEEPGDDEPASDDGDESDEDVALSGSGVPTGGDADAIDTRDDTDAGIDDGDGGEIEEEAVDWEDETYAIDADESGFDADAYEIEYESEDQLGDDSWAGEWVIDEDEAALPLDATAAEYDYAAVEAGDDADWVEEADVPSDEDSLQSGSMPTVRLVRRSGGGAVSASGMRPAGGARPSGGTRPAAARSGAAPGDDDDVPYSIGGRPVGDRSVPWQAQIFGPFPAERWPAKAREGKELWQLQHLCGGTLIAKDWVLTAAHCIDQDMVTLGYKVRLGSRDISKGDGVVYRIDRIVRHSQYDAKASTRANPNMYANDIALIRIVPDGPAKPRDPRRVREILLYKGRLPAGTAVSATGWGTTQPTETVKASAVMMRVDLQLMDTALCQKLEGYGPRKIHGKVFCAAHPTRQTCRGDSGGPVFLTNGQPQLVGIVSWGKRRCAGDGKPGVYTRIDRYFDWIAQAMAIDPLKNQLP